MIISARTPALAVWRSPDFELIYTSTSEQGSLLISVALSDKKEAL